jgi:hypothetical protein
MSVAGCTLIYIRQNKHSEENKMSNMSNSFAAAMTAKFPDNEFTVQSGRKYDKIVIRSTKYTHSGESVHAFVIIETGELVKAAGWNAPQKNADGSLAVRYQMDTPDALASVVAIADQYGAYLYAR